ncbi:MFS transporter [Salipiger bermudensis]|uniref:MFS transporter n=1 Tax=Salipiger bermudensis TaxID=344736 RepID=UPI00300AEDFF
MGFKHDLLASRGPAAAFAVMGLYWGGFAALVPALKPQAGLSDEGFGLAMLVSTCGAVLAMWLAPVAERRLGALALPVLSVLLAGAFLLPGVATGWQGFALAMLAAAGAAGLLDVVMNAQVAGLEASIRRPLMNLNHAVYSLVYAVSALATGLARELGASPLVAFAGLGLAALLLVAVMGSAPTAAAHGDGRTTRGATPWRLILPAGLVVLIGFLSEQATEGWSALHLERNLGAGAAAGAVGPALLGITMTVGRLFGQGLAQRFAEPAVIRIGAAVSACGALLAAFAPSLWIAYAGFAILGLGASVIVPMAFAFVGARCPAERRAQAISRLSVIGYAGFFLGPPLMGLVSGGIGLAAAFAMVALILLLIPLALIPWMRRSTPA